MVNFGLIGQAAAMFAVTNVDDIVLLALFFGRASGRGGAARVVAGQYLGFAGILALSIVGAFGAGLLPDSVLPWLGLVPLLLGLRAAWRVWRKDDEGDEPEVGPGVLAVAGVTFANGGDNIGVYVPVFANTGTSGLVVYAVVFLALVAVWCAAGRYFATRPVIARALARWGHLLLPVVLVGIGVLILLSA
ncbi:cadmium transporter [Amycolatopsis thailandensis]|uniref:Cadmium transporter n=1 Tax=Amycolatopsis thailandensis TaxID=589330 RepID=A0A229S909_9PSEU|nr:cadmium transporter [Amycolatopsis thailandensis]